MQLLKDKIDQLNAQAWDVRVSDSTLAFELSKEAVRLSREISYTKTKILQSALNGHDYKPLVTVGTNRLGDKVLVSVSDNGTGIPEKIVDKIFQPFFTTKPTGQGTGLGLSLAYDIIKAQGGEIKVQTIEGKGSEFIITLPRNAS
jgi:signal transduction histidine kinase